MARKPKPDASATPALTVVPDVPRRKVSSAKELRSAHDYATRIGAKWTGPRRMVVMAEGEDHYTKDKCSIWFDPYGNISFKGDRIAANGQDVAPTDDEIQFIKDEFSRVEFPYSIAHPDVKDVRSLGAMPDFFKAAKSKDLWVFRNEKREILMVQVRSIDEQGNKHYHNCTPFSDGTWQFGDPDGGLPIWGMEHYRNQDILFLSEGCKAGEIGHRIFNSTESEDNDLIEACGIAGECRGMLSMGWVGGAERWRGVDFRWINSKKFKKVIVCADNDELGMAAAIGIAKRIKTDTWVLDWAKDWDRRFPEKFDIADPFPKSLYVSTEKGRAYVGPMLKDMLVDWTFLTEMEETDPDEKKQPREFISEHTRNKVIYLGDQHAFIDTSHPHIARKPEELCMHLSPRTIGDTTIAKLYAKVQSRTIRSTIIMPGLPQGVINYRGHDYYNIYRPSRIRPVKISTAPFHKLVDYIVVDEDDKRNFLKFIYTLIARPDVKMNMAMLLCSELQGLGKSMFNDYILTELVGPWNVSPANIEAIMSGHNGFIENKKLIAVDEIYSDEHKYKVAGKLKDMITQDIIFITDKYVKSHDSVNMATFIACSNIPGSIGLENRDRRWFIPALRQEWGEHSRDEWHNYCSWFINTWLRKEGGYNALMYEAMNWEHGYFADRENAPETKAKEAFRQDGLSQGQRIVQNASRDVAEMNKAACLNDWSVNEYVKNALKLRAPMPPRQLRADLVIGGLKSIQPYIRRNGLDTHMMCNQQMIFMIEDAIKEGADNKKLIAILRSGEITMEDLIDEEQM